MGSACQEGKDSQTAPHEQPHGKPTEERAQAHELETGMCTTWGLVRIKIKHDRTNNPHLSPETGDCNGISSDRKNSTRGGDTSK